MDCLWVVVMSGRSLFVGVWVWVCVWVQPSWNVSALYLLACQVIGTVGDSSLCLIFHTIA